MDIFVARQPIFDNQMKVVAYELLYRSGNSEISVSTGDDASLGVINWIMTMNLETLTDKKTAFIKFSRNLILDETETLFPLKMIVVEVMDDIASDDELVQALRSLKMSGGTIALDNYNEKAKVELIRDVSNYVKIDFQANDLPSIERSVKRFKGTPIKLLAEKVETQEQFKEAVRIGFSLFQGYFFAKPDTLRAKDLKSLKGSQIMILNELSAPEVDFGRISEIIARDLSLSYKVLKLVNSAAYSGFGHITSIRQALVRIGIKEVRKLVTLVLMSDAGQGKPEELIITSMIRARALEELADNVGLGKRKSEFFMMGIFSLIDAILDRPMEAVLAELPLEDGIKAALLGHPSDLRNGLDIIMAYEQADWDHIEQIGLFGDGMTDEMLFAAYFKAIKWGHELSHAAE